MITELLVIQPLDFCNLNCSYCYLPGRRDPKLMTQEVLDAVFRAVFNSSMVAPLDKNDVLSMVWHSGEPLVAGMDFYKNAIQVINKYNIHSVKIKNQIQTNATLINQSWCEFFIENNLYITVSLDGPEFLHDKYRKNWNGHGSFKKVMRGVEFLQKNAIPLNAVCVLTRDSLDYPEEIYQFFKENGFKRIGFNTEESLCLNTQSTLESSEVDQQFGLFEKYASFVSRLYDLWIADNRSLWIREFAELLGQMQVKKQTPLLYQPNPSTLAFNIVSITKDGDIATFSPEMTLGTLNNPKQFFIGNVLDIKSLDDLASNENFKEQLTSIKKGVEQCAKECEYFELCGGGNPVNKMAELGTFEGTETVFCKLSKKIHIDTVLSKLLSNTHNALTI